MIRTKSIFSSAFAVAAAVLASGCGPRSSPDKPAASADVVAVVGDRAVTKAELEAELARSGPDLPRAQVVEALVRRKLLLAKAQAEGFDQSAELRAEWERLVANRYQERNSPVVTDKPAVPVSDAEVEARYRTAQARWTLPEQIRARMLFLHISPKADAAARAARRQEAEALFARWQKSDDTGAAALARESSEDQSARYRGGDTGLLTPEKAAAEFDAPVMDAWLKLREPGNSALVETPRGFFLVRLSSRAAASVRPLAEVRDVIRQELAAEMKAKSEEDFWTGLKSGVAIQINQAAVDSIQLAARTNRAGTAPPAIRR